MQLHKDKITRRTPMAGEGSESATANAGVARRSSRTPVVERFGPQRTREGIARGLAVLMILAAIQAVLSAVGLAIGLGLWD